MMSTKTITMLIPLLLLASPSLAFQLDSNKVFLSRRTPAPPLPSLLASSASADSVADATASQDDTDNTSNNNNNNEKRAALIKDLLSLAASFDRGFGASPSARTRADTIIRELEGYNPEENASYGINGNAVSPLEGAWRMIWTTASDVLVLGASPVATVGAIYQIFEPPIVTNVIDFIPRVQSLLPPSVIPSSLVRAKVQTRASLRNGFPNRVGLLFEAVELQPVEFLGMDASTLPPFAANLPKLPGTDNTSDSSTGPGYFDVSYLDDELLIIRQNAPGGLFALVKVTDSDP